MKKILIYLFFLSIILSPLAASSAGLVPCGGQGEHYCTLADFFTMLGRIYTFFLLPSPLNQNIPIVPAVAGLMMVIAGFMYVSGTFMGGGPGSVQTANAIFKYVVIGLIVIYGAHIFVTLFLKTIGATIFPSWNTFPSF